MEFQLKFAPPKYRACLQAEGRQTKRALLPLVHPSRAAPRRQQTPGRKVLAVARTGAAAVGDLDFEWASRGPGLLARTAQKKPNRDAEWHRLGRRPDSVGGRGLARRPLSVSVPVQSSWFAFVCASQSQSLPRAHHAPPSGRRCWLVIISLEI